MGSYSTLIACCEGVELYVERKLIRDVAQDVRLEREWGRTTKPNFMVLVEARAGELTVFPHLTYTLTYTLTFTLTCPFMCQLQLKCTM